MFFPASISIHKVYLKSTEAQICLSSFCAHTKKNSTTNLMRLLYNWCAQENMASTLTRHTLGIYAVMEPTVLVTPKEISTSYAKCMSKLKQENFIALNLKAQRLLTIVDTYRRCWCCCCRRHSVYVCLCVLARFFLPSTWEITYFDSRIFSNMPRTRDYVHKIYDILLT